MTMPYQVYADYTYDTSFEAPVIASNNLSQQIIARIKTNKPLTIACIGTSISWGGDTLQRTYFNSDSDCYWNLAAKSLARIYKAECVVRDYSVPGGGCGIIAPQISAIIVEKPDLVLIELGINDHTKRFGHFKFALRIKQLIRKLQCNGILVVLVGFFQQNKAWDRENPQRTLQFNATLSSIAKRQKIPFVDIYAQFERVGYDKTINDLLADYIHHPTAFGHQLYYQALMPVLIPQPMTEGQLFDILHK